VAGRFPPLRNLRKTTVIAIAFFLGFFIHRVVTIFVDDEVHFTDNSDIELSPANSVVCRHIVNGEPFGSDSVFEENTRLYVFSSITNSARYQEDTLFHIWFLGIDTIFVEPCNLTGDVCSSMLASDLVELGEWSVDLVAGRKLLASRQFRVVTPSR
jgi:hypothetical protein